MKLQYSPGKCDYTGNGRKDCRAVIEWELKSSELAIIPQAPEHFTFSMSGTIWNALGTDCYQGGQCVDSIAEYFPDDSKLARMVRIWERWHLNDMKAGSPAQMAWLESHPEIKGYDEKTAALAAAGLNPDPGYMHNGKPYKYGTAWLKETIPAEIIQEIRDWGGSINGVDPADEFKAFLTQGFEFGASCIGFDSERKMDEYRITLARKPESGKKRPKAFTFDWLQGTGHRKDKRGKQWSEKRAREGSSMFNEFSPLKSAPDAAQVVAGLFRDAQAYDENRDVMDFIDSYGYDDKKKGRAAYTACERVYSDLQEIFGADFSRLISEVL